MGRDQPGLWGPPAPRASPPWPEPGWFLARPEMALPDVPLARSAQGCAFATLVIVTPLFCPSWGPLMSSRGQGDAQPFPPCPLWTPGKQLGAPSPFTPSWGGRAWGLWAGSCAPLPCCSRPWQSSGQGAGMAPGAGPFPGQRFGKHGTAVPTRQHLAGRAAPLPHPQPSHARGDGQSGHVAAGRLALPGARAGVATLPSCSGRVPRLAGAGAGERRPWQGFSSGLGSLAVLAAGGPGLGTP